MIQMFRCMFSFVWFGMSMGCVDVLDTACAFEKTETVCEASNE